MIRKIFSISVMLALLVMFSMADAGYAFKSVDNLSKGQVTDDTKDKADGKTSKKSVLHGVDTLIQGGRFVEEQAFTSAEFRDMRFAYGRQATGDSTYTISDGMLTRELNSMIAMGLIERVSPGNYRVLATVNDAQMRQIDQRLGQEVASLTRADGERANTPIGLNSYDLTEATNTTEQQQIRDIVNEVIGRPVTAPEVTTLASAMTLQDVQRNFNNFTNQRIIAVTEDNIADLTPARRDEIVQQVASGEYALAIATTISDVSREDIERILGQFPNSEQLIALVNDNVFFSLIEDNIMLDNIAALNGGTLTTEQANAIRAALMKG